MIGYLGPDGTFSYEAAHNYFKGSKEELCKFSSIYSLIKAVDDGELDSAIVPIENSLEGSVNATLDTLAFDSELFICGEYTMKVKENLMSAPGAKPEDIKRIISHPQPIGQCSEMIHKYFPDVRIEYTNSTAEAAKIISETNDKTTASIGPAACAELYGLEILMADCSDEKNNATRFVELKKTENETVTGNDKSSFIFTVDHKPGCLFKAIEAIAANGVNMLKIESRPEKKVFGRYIFFIDTDGNIRDENVKQAWDKIKEVAYKCKFLGSYRKG